MTDSGNTADPYAWSSDSAVSPLFPSEREYLQGDGEVSPVASQTSLLPQVTITASAGEMFHGRDHGFSTEDLPELSESVSPEPEGDEEPTESGRSLAEELESLDTEDTGDPDLAAGTPMEDAGASSGVRTLFDDDDPDGSDHIVDNEEDYAADGGGSPSESHFSTSSSEVDSDVSSVHSEVNFEDRSRGRNPPGAAFRDDRSPVGRVRKSEEESGRGRKRRVKSKKHSPLRTSSITRDGAKITVVSPKSGIRVIDDPSLADEMNARDDQGIFSISPIERYLAQNQASTPADEPADADDFAEAPIVTADDSILVSNGSVAGLGIEFDRPATPAPGDVRPDEDGYKASRIKSSLPVSKETGKLREAEITDSLRFLWEQKYPFVIAKILQEEPPYEADIDDRNFWWQVLRWQHEEHSNSMYAYQQEKRHLENQLQSLELKSTEAWDYVHAAKYAIIEATDKSTELESQVEEHEIKISKQREYMIGLEEQLDAAELKSKEKEELETRLLASRKLLQESQDRVVRLQTQLDETRKPLLGDDDVSEMNEVERIQAELVRTRNDLNNTNHIISQLRQQQTYTLGISSSIKEPWPRDTRPQVADMIVAEVNRDLKKGVDCLTRGTICNFLDWGYGIRKIFEEVRDAGYKFNEKEALRSLLTSNLIYNNFDLFSAFVFADPPITEDEFLRRMDLLQENFDDISRRVMPMGKMEDILARELKEKQALVDASAKATEEIENLKSRLGDDDERRRRDRERIPLAEQDMKRVTVKENARLIKEVQKLRAQLDAERQDRKNDQEKERLGGAGAANPDHKRKSDDSRGEESTENTGAKKDGDDNPEGDRPETPAGKGASKQGSDEPESICTISRHIDLEKKVQDLEAQLSGMPDLAIKVAELEVELKKARSALNDDADTEDDEEISAVSVLGPPPPDAQGNIDDKAWKNFDASTKKEKILLLKNSRNHWIDLVKGHQREHAYLTYSQNEYFETQTELRKDLYHTMDELEFFVKENESLEQRLGDTRSSAQLEIRDLKREKEAQAAVIRRLESRAERFPVSLRELRGDYEEPSETGEVGGTKGCHNCRRLQAANDRLQGQNRDLQAAMETPKPESDHITTCSNCGRLSAEVEELKRQSEVLRSEARTAKMQSDGNKEIARDATDKLDALKKTLDEMTASENSADPNLTSENDKLKKEISNVRKEVEALKVAAEKMAADGRDHAAGLSDEPWLKPASVRFLPALPEEQQAELQNLRTELAEAKAAIADSGAGTALRVETSKLREKLDIEKYRTARQEQRISELEQTNSLLTTQIADLRNQEHKKLNHHDNIPGDSKTTIIELETQLKSSREEFEFIKEMYSISKRQETDASAQLERLLRDGKHDPRFYDPRLRRVPEKAARERATILKNKGEEAAAEFDKEVERDIHHWHHKVRKIFGGDVPGETEPADPLELSKHKLDAERVEHDKTTDRLKYVEAQLARLKQDVERASKADESGPLDMHTYCREIERGLVEKCNLLRDSKRDDTASLKERISVLEDKNRHLVQEVEKRRIAVGHYQKEAEGAGNADITSKEAIGEPAFIEPAELDRINDPGQLRQLCAVVETQRSIAARSFEDAFAKNRRLEELYFTAQAQNDKAQRELQNLGEALQDTRDQAAVLQVRLDTERTQAAKLQTELDMTRSQLVDAEAQVLLQKRLAAAQTEPEHKGNPSPAPPSSVLSSHFITAEEINKINDVSQLKKMCEATEMFRRKSEAEYQEAVKKNQRLQQRLFTLSSESKTRIRQLEADLNEAATRLEAANRENDRTKDVGTEHSHPGNHKEASDLEAHLERARASAETALKEAEAAQSALKTVQSKPDDSGELAKLRAQLEKANKRAEGLANWRKQVIPIYETAKKHNVAMRNRLEQARVHITDLEQTNIGLLERQNRWLGIMQGIDQRATEAGEQTEELRQAIENTKAVFGDGTTEEILAQLHEFFNDGLRVPGEELEELRKKQTAREAAGKQSHASKTKTRSRASAEELLKAKERAEAAEKRNEDLVRDRAATDVRIKASQVLNTRYRAENVRLRNELESFRGSSTSGTSGNDSKDKYTSSTEATAKSTVPTSASQSTYRNHRPQSIKLSMSHSSLAAHILSPARYLNDLAQPRSIFTPARRAVTMPPPPHPRWLPQTKLGAERAAVRPLKEDLKHQNDRNMNGALATAQINDETHRHNEWAQTFMHQVRGSTLKTRTTAATRERARGRGYDVPRKPEVDEEDREIEEERRQAEHRRLLEAQRSILEETTRQDEQRRRDEGTRLERGLGRHEPGGTKTAREKHGDSSKTQHKSGGTDKGNPATDEPTKSGVGMTTTAAAGTETATGTQTHTVEDAATGHGGAESPDSEDETLGWTYLPIGAPQP